jgi:4-hydroxy-2-oxoglutarate aldolase
MDSAIAWLKGLFPPIATAFAADGSLALPPEGYLEWLRDGGLDGVVALGSNGEAASLTDDERLTWIRSVKARLPSPLRLIVGTGAESSRATIERTKAAADLGAEAALVIAPSYYQRQLTVEALRRHYHAVAEASPIPVLVYNVPGHMGYDLGAERMIAVAGHRNIAGLKDSSGDIGRLPQLRAALGPDFVLLTGTGEKLLDALTHGADGAIAALANLAPAGSANIRHDWQENRLQEAEQHQKRIAPLGQALTHGYGVPGLKAALRLLGFNHGDPRPPLPPLPASELPEVRRLLTEAQLEPRALAS